MKFNKTFIYTLMNFLLYNLKESFTIQFKESFIYNLKNFLKISSEITAGDDHHRL